MMLRLFGFRPASPSELTDRRIRESIESALAELGAEFVYSGRGTDGRGELRRVVTIWPDATDEALAERLKELVQPEAALDATECSVELLPLALSLTFDETEPASILRVFRGRTRPDDLDSYVADAHAGTLADAEAQHGPLALFLAVDQPDRFMNGPLDIGLFTIRQRRTDTAMMGRAFAISMALNFSGFPVGAVLAGVLAERSLDLAIVAAVIACAAGTVLTALLVPKAAPPEIEALADQG